MATCCSIEDFHQWGSWEFFSDFGPSIGLWGLKRILRIFILGIWLDSTFLDFQITDLQNLAGLGRAGAGLGPRAGWTLGWAGPGLGPWRRWRLKSGNLERVEIWEYKNYNIIKNEILSCAKYCE